MTNSSCLGYSKYMVRHYDVITIGETTIDAFMTLHDDNVKCHLNAATGELCFKHGEKINVQRYDFCIGGNATNVAVGLSRLGLKATLMTEVGDDEFSIKIRNTLANEHIDRLLIVEKRNAPSNFSVVVNFKEDRTIFVEDVERKHDFHFTDVTANWIYLTSLGKEWEHPYEKALEFAEKNTVKIAFNPGHLQLRELHPIVAKVIKQTDLLIVNKEEAEKIILHHYKKGVDNSKSYIETLLAQLQELGAKMVVITNGKHGSYALDQSGTYYAEGLYPGKVVERTGAGDAYGSGLLAGVQQNISLPDAMRWGAINASSVIGQIGAQAGLLKKEEIEKKV